VVDYFPIVVCLLWAGAVVYGIVDWATITWSSQGRLVFSALPALSLLLVLGVAGWLPKRPSRIAVTSLSAFMFVVAAVAPFLWIRPAYQVSADEPQLTHLAAVNFNDQIELGGYSVTVLGEGETAVPGASVLVELEWIVLQPMTRNWSVFVHLNDPVLGQPIAQRDMYWGQGLMATSFLQPGDRVVNRYQLQLPETAVAPADLELVVGLYDFYTGERLPTVAGDALVWLDSILMEAAPGNYPNPVAVNFEDQFTLLGYELMPRRLQADET
ncbi:MAG: hypothetical protein GY943_35175, partial [Chloroflexi bacterium]|nr:hypothetical protein [Chloroflexota bacterium]